MLAVSIAFRQSLVKEMDKIPKFGDDMPLNPSRAQSALLNAKPLVKWGKAHWLA